MIFNAQYRCYLVHDRLDKQSYERFAEVQKAHPDKSIAYVIGGCPAYALVVMSAEDKRDNLGNDDLLRIRYENATRTLNNGLDTAARPTT